jgi:hypothetical protein
MKGRKEGERKKFADWSGGGWVKRKERKKER